MVCNKCGVDKPEEDFSFEAKATLSHTRKSTCKKCHSKLWGRPWYRKHRESHKRIVYKNRLNHRLQVRIFLYKYLKDHPCTQCSFDNPAALEFHHIGKKTKAISKMATEGYSLNVIKKEISQCIVLCANCHRILTAKDQKWYVSSGALEAPSLGIEPRLID